jgi:glutathionylspermidine synthase
MQRHRRTARAHWREKVEELGLTYHSHASGPYWDESACYELTRAEVEMLEAAGNTLHRLCIEAAGEVIERGWWDRLKIPAAAVPSILRSWERDDFSLYGRFDLAFDCISPPRLLEYNADTPTALVEAAVIQWFWLQETCPGADQFNSIHERLIQAWRRWAGHAVHFSSVKDSPEDEQTVLYLRDTCQQAGGVTRAVAIEDIGWDRRANCFVDLERQPIRHCFKLYPWEWLWREEFARHLADDPIAFIEPAWKMLLSNKGLLPVLWELFPGHENLLPAFDNPEPLSARYVRKPLLGREGSNVTWIEGGLALEENAGGYGEEGFIYQQPASLPAFEGQHPVFGLWIVDHEAAGLGIREDSRRITGNLSRFVPHFFR